MKLLLDDMIGPRVAQELRGRGLDLVAVAERTDLRALPDDAVFDVADEEGRVLVTLNIGDFARLHQRWLSEERQHSGLVMVPTHTFPQNCGFVGALVSALHEAATNSSLPTAGDVLYLRPPARS